jgi:hypothetical protein
LTDTSTVPPKKRTINKISWLWLRVICLLSLIQDCSFSHTSVLYSRCMSLYTIVWWYSLAYPLTISEFVRLVWKLDRSERKPIARSNQAVRYLHTWCICICCIVAKQMPKIYGLFLCCERIIVLCDILCVRDIRRNPE